MAGDFTRLTFDPKDGFSGVLMQQGRVQLDADWNEMVEIFDRRWRAETIDIIGRCIVPREIPDGFKISPGAGGFTIGRGRIYVDGLLAENHGTGELESSPMRGELWGKEDTKYGDQPYLPVFPALPASGPHLVYLDVWQREVTALEEPDIREIAVGVDTATRLQTVWQVKVLPDVVQGVTCDTDMPGWKDLTRPSAGRLTTQDVGVPSSEDPCVIPPNGGYRGPDNKLCRVEIHDKGPLGTATFKWAWHNASVATEITAIGADRKTLSVERIGRDPVLRFNPNDWVEITDDGLELAGDPGIMRKIDSVDEVNLTVTLTAELPAGQFTNPDRHTRVRRWDQKGKILDAGGNTVADVDDPANPGVIKVPAAGTRMVLEDGAEIGFGAEPADGSFRVGDYWVFAVRSADASVEPLRDAPPRGIHHHYCQLAVVTFPAGVVNHDCREFWPLEVPDAGCACAACVTADSHNDGTMTIQMAIDEVKGKGGGKVCLGPGTYWIKEPIDLTNAHSIRLEGSGTGLDLRAKAWGTVLLYAIEEVPEGQPPVMITIAESSDVVVERLSIVTSDATAVKLVDSEGVTLQNCHFKQLKAHPESAPAIAMVGRLNQTHVRQNIVDAGIGIANVDDLILSEFHVEDNILVCERTAISLNPLTFHNGNTALARNLITNCRELGISVHGEARIQNDSRTDIVGNYIRPVGSVCDSIVVGTDDARVNGNAIRGFRGGNHGRDGIVVRSEREGQETKNIRRLQVVGNSITGLGGNGISIQSFLESAMIKQNVIEDVSGNGIVMAEESSGAVELSIENNQLLNVALGLEEGEDALGMRLVNARRLAVVGNMIRGVGRAKDEFLHAWGISVLASSFVRIAGNQLAEIGRTAIGESAGIKVLSSFERLDVEHNVVLRTERPSEELNRSPWRALVVVGTAKFDSDAPERRRPILDRPSFDGFEVDVSTVVADFPPFVLARPLEGIVLDVFPRDARVRDKGHEFVSVRGNVLEAWGGAPAVEIRAVASCAFSDNRCVLTPGPDVDVPVVQIEAGAVIASSNFIHILDPLEHGATSLQLSGPDSMPLTVIGNILDGTISVGNNPLGPPWALLNRTL